MANTCRSGNPVGITASGHDKPFEPATFPDDEPPVGSKSRPTFGHSLDFGGRRCREEWFELLGEIFKYRPIRVDARRSRRQLISAGVGVQRFRLPAPEQQTLFPHPAV